MMILEAPRNLAIGSVVDGRYKLEAELERDHRGRAPSPPAPMHKTLVEQIFFCPAMPTSGKIKWRE